MHFPVHAYAKGYVLLLTVSQHNPFTPHHICRYINKSLRTGSSKMSWKTRRAYGQLNRLRINAPAPALVRVTQRQKPQPQRAANENDFSVCGMSNNSIYRKTRYYGCLAAAEHQPTSIPVHSYIHIYIYIYIVCVYIHAHIHMHIWAKIVASWCGSCCCFPPLPSAKCI